MNYNYYNILGVNTTAATREIKLAYKKLAIQYHPDKHQGNTFFEEKFKLVNEAYQVLSNPQKRLAYDLKLQYLVQQKLRQQAQQQQYRYQEPVRRPASVSERHYRNIQPSRFLKKDWYLVAAFFAAILVFSFLLKFAMDHIAARERYQQAIISLDKQEWGRAYSFLNEAIYFKPRFAEAYLKRAYIEMEIYENYPAALPDLDAAIRYTDENAAKIYYLRGKCYEGLHRGELAEMNLTQAIVADKFFAMAYYDRGMVRAVSLNKYSEAIRDFTWFLNSEAAADSTLEKQALYYRGFCFYLTQQNPLAVKDYRQALQKNPQNARLYFLLGKSQAEMDSTQAACRNFQKAFDLGFKAAIGDIQRVCP